MTDGQDMTPYEEQVRARAHELWLRAGSPPGKDDYFWHKAEAEIKAEAVQSAGVGPAPKS